MPTTTEYDLSACADCCTTPDTQTCDQCDSGSMVNRIAVDLPVLAIDPATLPDIDNFTCGCAYRSGQTFDITGPTGVDQSDDGTRPDVGTEIDCGFFNLIEDTGCFDANTGVNLYASWTFEWSYDLGSNTTTLTLTLSFAFGNLTGFISTGRIWDGTVSGKLDCEAGGPYTVSPRIGVTDCIASGDATIAFG